MIAPVPAAHLVVDSRCTTALAIRSVAIVVIVAAAALNTCTCARLVSREFSFDRSVSGSPSYSLPSSLGVLDRREKYSPIISLTLTLQSAAYSTT